ncbi:MAG: alpha-ribazole phosphatase [Ignavibacteriota bacterium]
MTTRIWLVRHGEPAGMRGRCYGKLDVGLSEAGRAQMQRTAECLRGEALEAIYTSPRARTTESALILGASHSCDCRSDDALCEIDFGEFEGMPYDEISVRYPELYRQWMESPTEVQFPGGESFATMRARVLRAFDAILERHVGSTVAIVTHGGVVRILLAWALEMPDPLLLSIGAGLRGDESVVGGDGRPDCAAHELHPRSIRFSMIAQTAGSQPFHSPTALLPR